MRTTEEALPSGSQASDANWDGQLCVVMGVSLVSLGASRQEERAIRGRSSSEGKRKAENWADEAGTDGRIAEGGEEGEVRAWVQ